MATTISYISDGGIATILLDSLNGKPPTLDGDVLAQLERCIERAREESPRLVFVRSSSARYFCVGADVNVLKETNEKTIVPWVMEGHRVLNLLEGLPMPVVAVVEGYAMGGGLELAMACDLIFASDTAQMAQSEAGLGFIPGWGATRRLKERVGSAKAKYLFYSGKLLAVEAAAMGLVEFVGDRSQLENELKQFGESVTGNNRNAISQFKEILNNQEGNARDENAAIEAFGSISCLHDADAKKRLGDFLERKKSK